MVYVEKLAPDTFAPGNSWPVPLVAPGFTAHLIEVKYGEELRFSEEDYLFVPMGTKGWYRPVRVFAGGRLFWTHDLREFLIDDLLPHLREAPLASCLVVSTGPDPGFAEREEAARLQKERQKKSRQDTNRRALERALERAHQGGRQQSVTPAPSAPTPPAPAPAPAPVAPAPPAPAPFAFAPAPAPFFFPPPPSPLGFAPAPAPSFFPPAPSPLPFTPDPAPLAFSPAPAPFFFPPAPSPLAFAPAPAPFFFPPPPSPPDFTHAPAPTRGPLLGDPWMGCE
ncbi:hypothetical protein EAE96_000783 [Botrytis aclada]|nr:hypothetical protein EAE96_000783 [Botrytis aclada]